MNSSVGNLKNCTEVNITQNSGVTLDDFNRIMSNLIENRAFVSEIAKRAGEEFKQELLETIKDEINDNNEELNQPDTHFLMDNALKASLKRNDPHINTLLCALIKERLKQKHNSDEAILTHQALEALETLTSSQLQYIQYCIPFNCIIFKKEIIQQCVSKAEDIEVSNNLFFNLKRLNIIDSNRGVTLEELKQVIYPWIKMPIKYLTELKEIHDVEFTDITDSWKGEFFSKKHIETLGEPAKSGANFLKEKFDIEFSKYQKGELEVLKETVPPILKKTCNQPNKLVKLTPLGLFIANLIVKTFENPFSFEEILKMEKMKFIDI